MSPPLQDIPPLAALLSAYAGRDAERHRLLWAFDVRLAQIVRTTTEPVIGQMRLAWWQDVLTDGSDVKGRGEPLLAALRAAGLAGHPGLIAMLDGWEALIGDVAPDPIALQAFGTGRGGGLFRAMAGAEAAAISAAAETIGAGMAGLNDAGALWALWDLSGHVGSMAEAQAAIEVAQGFADGADCRRWKPMRLAAGLARHDVVRGRAAPRTLTPRLYARLVRLALIGR